MPNYIYGTAWKEANTKDLVTLALNSGFRAIDTANQAKHYNEILVGEALKQAFDNGLSRHELWLQTKFTSIHGQDHRLPYNPNAPLGEQVKQSFTSSLEHLNVDYLDSYLLHGPYNYPDLGAEDFIVWEAIEQLYNQGLTKAIGISNVNLLQIKRLIDSCKIKPMFVQNRCFASNGWDKAIRDFCLEHNIAYQGFSLLTANPQILHNEQIAILAQKYNVKPAQIIFKFSEQIGMIPLTGTSSKVHMQEDLAIDSFALTSSEVDLIELMGV